jgi:hypothetical protein
MRNSNLFFIGLLSVVSFCSFAGDAFLKNCEVITRTFPNFKSECEKQWARPDAYEPFRTCTVTTPAGTREDEVADPVTRRASIKLEDGREVLGELVVKKGGATFNPYAVVNSTKGYSLTFAEVEPLLDRLLKQFPDQTPQIIVHK